MNDALIGYTGFVGSTLLKQRKFEALYRSGNIGDIRAQQFDILVCAGAPAQKWIANRDPETDRHNICLLIDHLRTVKCNRMVLISTVDVFKDPVDVDESTAVDESGLHAYGMNRRFLEKFVQDHFPAPLIIRLPGLVGPGLRKNAIFDFVNENNLHTVDSRAIFQFYPMVNLWSDIYCALQSDLSLIHLTAEPISIADVSLHGFGKAFFQELSQTPANYNMRTRFASTFGASGSYQYGVRETLQAIRCYAQSETVAPRSGQEPVS